MKGLKRNWEVLVIHHSHTDIGYTERQELIESYHIDYIKQAIHISERIANGEKELEGFRWTCEVFWAVEKFLEEADNNLKRRFEDAVKRGHIELTGNYLNLNEIIDDQVLRNVTKRSVNYANAINNPIDCAITADINGYSWGYSQMLYDMGIRNFTSCLHTHHGMFVGEAKQRPFYWETPKGDKLLVWMGDHYTLGNELGIVPNALFHYMIQDEYNLSNAPYNSEDRFEIGYKRIKRYLKNLESEGYPYNFVPVMVSGLVTDNAPPNPKIMEHIHQWNESYGEQVTIKMVSLDEFFKQLRKEEVPIPTYKGDWPDWWAEGMASTPLPLKLFREAQRTLKVTRLIDKECEMSEPDMIKKAEDMMMVYAEHTWGYSASIYEPWTKMVHTTDYRNIGYANNAHELVFRNYDKVLYKKGRVGLTPERQMVYTIENPYDVPLHETVRLYVDFMEADLIANGFKIMDVGSQQEYVHQLDIVARGTEVCVPIQLGAKESLTLEILPYNISSPMTTKSNQNGGSEGVIDVQRTDGLDLPEVSEHSIETNTIKIQWSDKGIYSWKDKTTGKELIRMDKKYNAFTPIYEITSVENDSLAQMEVRKSMGRNRKGFKVKRDVGQLIGVKNVKAGTVFAQVELEYVVKGTHFYSVLLTVYQNTTRVDVAVRLNKTNEWSPENLYVSLPFGVGDNELWVEKTGSMFRPRIDQIQGSNTDFYCIQEGLGLIGHNYGIAIATPDTPLIQLGDLSHKPVRLHEINNPLENNDYIYSWTMNNFWETNFKATLGEVYEFEYHIDCGKHIVGPEQVQALCFQLNAGSVIYRTKKA